MSGVSGVLLKEYKKTAQNATSYVCMAPDRGERVWERCITALSSSNFCVFSMIPLCVRQIGIVQSACWPNKHWLFCQSCRKRAGWMAVFLYTNDHYEHWFNLQPADLDRPPWQTDLCHTQCCAWTLCDVYVPAVTCYNATVCSCQGRAKCCEEWCCVCGRV